MTNSWSCHARMLRYIYLLLCLLACIEWTFCYDYISNSNFKHGRVGKQTKLVRRRHRPNIERRRCDEDGGVDDKDPVAEIDVASFIQQPDYDAVDETGRFLSRESRRRSASNNYGNYGSLTGDKIEDELNNDETNANLDDSENSNSDAVEGAPIQNSYADNTKLSKENEHKPKKKYVHIKFPFFSHDKSITTREKSKKRKVDSSNSLKKQDDTQVYKNELHGNINNQPEEFKLFKRSYEQHICPMCKRKFTPNNNFEGRKRRVPHKIIHNSRQYFQDVNSLKDAKAKNIQILKESKRNKLAKSKSESKEDLDDRRKKREERNFERERQLKELEEVQRKVESVEVVSVPYSNHRPVDKKLSQMRV